MIAAIQTRWAESKGKDKEARKLHLELFPEPFIGRVDAPAVLLSLNPGFDPKSDPDCHAKSVMRKAVQANLGQQPQAYPFYPLSPDFDGSAISK